MLNNFGGVLLAEVASGNQPPHQAGYTKDNGEYPIPLNNSKCLVFSFMCVEVKNKDEPEVVL